jgi:hypothetical protein
MLKVCADAATQYFVKKSWFFMVGYCNSKKEVIEYSRQHGTKVFNSLKGKRLDGSFRNVPEGVAGAGENFNGEEYRQ